MTSREWRKNKRSWWDAFLVLKEEEVSCTESPSQLEEQVWQEDAKPMRRYEESGQGIGNATQRRTSWRMSRGRMQS